MRKGNERWSGGEGGRHFAAEVEDDRAEVFLIVALDTGEDFDEVGGFVVEMEFPGGADRLIQFAGGGGA